MPDDIVIRPLTAEDVPAADRAGFAALRFAVPEEQVGDEEVRAARGRARVAHLLSTDPDGCWVAEADGAGVVGVALALLREGVWGLSLLGVDPDWQGRRIGSRVLEPALRYADGARGAIIVASTHPAAMRAYATAGFALRPCVSAAGVLDRRAIPAGLRSRPGDVVRDRETCDVASRHARGAAHGPDLEMYPAAGCDLLVIDGEGFAMHREGSVVVLAATTEAAARDLLWSSFAAAPPGATVHVDWIAAGHDWAIEIALAAGLALSPDGPIFTRGDLGAMAPYLPSGAYL